MFAEIKPITILCRVFFGVEVPAESDADALSDLIFYQRLQALGQESHGWGVRLRVLNKFDSDSDFT